MRLLIDTHILLWHLEGDEKLSVSRRQLITDLKNDKFISIGSLWEIAIKLGLNKLSLSYSLKEIISYIESRDIILLPISSEHLIEISTMSLHHRDPFDRLFVAQAKVEDLAIMTNDESFDSYGVKVL